MVGACGVHGKNDECTQSFARKARRLLDLEIDGRITLKCILRKNIKMYLLTEAEF